MTGRLLIQPMHGNPINTKRCTLTSVQTHLYWYCKLACKPLCNRLQPYWLRLCRLRLCRFALASNLITNNRANSIILNQPCGNFIHPSSPTGSFKIFWFIFRTLEKRAFIMELIFPINFLRGEGEHIIASPLSRRGYSNRIMVHSPNCKTQLCKRSCLKFISAAHTVPFYTHANSVDL